MKRKFKVGDRVSTEYGKGTVKFVVDGNFRPYGISLDNKRVNGHDCNSKDIEYGHGYWANEDELTLIEEDKEEYFIELNTKRVKELIDKYKIESPIIKHTKDFRLQKVKELIKAVNTLEEFGKKVELKITIELDGKKIEL